MPIEEKWFFEEEEEEDSDGESSDSDGESSDSDGGSSKKQGGWAYIIMSIVFGFVGFLILGLLGGFLLFIFPLIIWYFGPGKGVNFVILILAAFLGLWFGGILAAFLLPLPIAAWLFSGSFFGEEGEGKFLRGMLSIAAFIPFFLVFLWPMIGSFFGSQVAMVGTSFDDFIGMISSQKDLLMNADYQRYLGVQQSVYDTSSQTYSSPTTSFEINSFTISPESGCFELNTMNFFGVVKNTGTLNIEGMKTGFYLDPTQIGTNCEQTITQMGHKYKCLLGQECIMGKCGLVLGEYFLNAVEPDCTSHPNHERWGCYCVDEDEVNTMNTLYPNAIGTFTKTIEMIDPSDPLDVVDAITCRLFAYAQAEYTVRSRLEVSMINSEYYILKGLVFSSVPAVQSIGPVQLRMGVGTQPIINNEDKRVLTVALGNEGNGELIDLNSVSLYVPTEFSSAGCEGGQFVRTVCSSAPSNIDNCEEMRSEGYNLFVLAVEATPYSSYSCSLTINENIKNLGGENRRSFVFLADASYNYMVKAPAFITGNRCV